MLRDFYDDGTIKALDGGIDKWEGIYAGKIPDMGHANCDLCKLFIEDKCKDCPVAHYVGVPLCEKTPYVAWYFEGPRDGYARTERDKELSDNELRFLKRIRKIISMSSGKKKTIKTFPMKRK